MTKKQKKTQSRNFVVAPKMPANEKRRSKWKTERKN